MTIAVDADAAAPMLGAPLAEYLAKEIPKVARQANGRYSYVPADDYEQTMWLAVLANPRRFKDTFDEGNLRGLNHRLKQAAAKATREDDRFRRAKRAGELGYSTDDEQFYSTGLLAKILPALIAADFDVSDAMQRASSGTDAAGIHIRSSDPFGGAENYLAMLLDITAAWKRLPEGQRRLLGAYYGVNQEDTEDGRWARQQLASSMGITAETLRQRAHRGLRRLQDELGGEDPWK
jgi:DNA-directed RNA polymerase specialized sigma24 family protein